MNDEMTLEVFPSAGMGTAPWFYGPKAAASMSVISRRKRERPF
jgi:hypothetical protein